MKGEPLPNPMRTDVKPVAIHTPVAISLHWEDKVHRDLMRDVALGVIEPVPINTLMTWCSRMVVVPKTAESQDCTKQVISLVDKALKVFSIVMVNIYHYLFLLN